MDARIACTSAAFIITLVVVALSALDWVNTPLRKGTWMNTRITMYKHERLEQMTAGELADFLDKLELMRRMKGLPLDERVFLHVVHKSASELLVSKTREFITSQRAQAKALQGKRGASKAITDTTLAFLGGVTTEAEDV